MGDADEFRLIDAVGFAMSRPALGTIALHGLIAVFGFIAAHAFGATYEEQYRPQYHFSPPQHWMNDPNGLVYLNGEYHLFYQFNPDADIWGPMHWGHAVSHDLLHWQHLPTALIPDVHGTIFSGSAVIDAQNTSGLGTLGNPPLIAIFTQHDDARRRAGRVDFQAQSIAYSLDGGRTWTKYSGNSVLPNPGLRDFRDPNVMWLESRKEWLMTLAVGDHISFYASKNLKNWRHLSDFGRDRGAHGGVWECPDVVFMRIEGEATTKAVLLVSVNPGGPNGGGGTQYFIGDFNGERFAVDSGVDESGAAARWLDYGTDDYAGVTWPKPPAQRHIFIGWMSDPEYAQAVPTVGWRGAMTLPRELELVRSPRGLVLHSNPIPELQRLRAAEIRLQPRILQHDETLAAGTTLPNSGLLELDAAVNLRDANLATLTFANAAGNRTEFRIDRKRRRYELDRSHSGAVDFP
jgi:fructan beta-fructosidase